MTTPALPTDSAIDKLEGCDDWPLWSTNIQFTLDYTWEYVKGEKASPPTEDKPEYPQWMVADCTTCQRIWLSLSKDIQQTLFHHSKSHASTLYKALKKTFEYSGATAEFYARQKFDNAKLSDYNTVSDFLTGLMGLAHLVNKETTDEHDLIQNCTIAMQTIHSLPPPMRPLQTILITTAPSGKTWDLDELCLNVETEELCARAP